MGASLASLGPDARRQAVAQITAQAALEVAAPKRSKFGNRRTAHKSIQGFERIYDSKLEAGYAEVLDQDIRIGMVKWWTPQPRFPLPGGVVYVADFLVAHIDGLRVVDTKGSDTQSSINKRKQVLACFGLEVEIVRRIAA
jgi:hypothetical protein